MSGKDYAVLALLLWIMSQGESDVHLVVTEPGMENLPIES